MNPSQFMQPADPTPLPPESAVDQDEFEESVRKGHFGCVALAAAVGSLLWALQFVRCEPPHPHLVDLASLDRDHHRISTAAIQVYSMDYDLWYPPAKNWMSLCALYQSSVDVFECPAVSKKSVHTMVAGTSGAELQMRGKYGHAMNSAAGGQREFEQPDNTVLTFCSTNLRWNANDPFVSCAYRYENKIGIGTVDGRAWMYKPERARLFRVAP